MHVKEHDDVMIYVELEVARRDVITRWFLKSVVTTCSFWNELEYASANPHPPARVMVTAG